MAIDNIDHLNSRICELEIALRNAIDAYGHVANCQQCGDLSTQACGDGKLADACIEVAREVLATHPNPG